LGGRGVALLKDAHEARRLSVRRLGNDLLISGYL